MSTVPLPDAERFCLSCNKLGHLTSECYATHGLNTPWAREVSRLVRAGAQQAPLPEPNSDPVDLIERPSGGSKTPEGSDANQCDGCRRGMPLRGEIHYNPTGDYDLMGCTAHRYAPALWEVAKAAYIAAPDNERDHSDCWQFVVDAIVRAMPEPNQQGEGRRARALAEPPLPEPYQGRALFECYSAEQMRIYGRACARAAVEALKSDEGDLGVTLRGGDAK